MGQNQIESPRFWAICSSVFSVLLTHVTHHTVPMRSSYYTHSNLGMDKSSSVECTVTFYITVPYLLCNSIT